MDKKLCENIRKENKSHFEINRLIFPCFLTKEKHKIHFKKK